MQVAVAILGFGVFEHDALSFCVRNALASDVDYALCERLDEADLVVADADAPDMVERIVRAARSPHVVFVGKTDVPGALYRVPRPIDPARVLRCLDEMAADLLRENDPTWAHVEAAVAPASAGLPPDDAPPAPAANTDDPRISTKARVRRAVRRAQSTRGSGPVLADVLVLDEKDDDRAALVALLERFGFVVHQAVSAEQAGHLLRRSYAAAFLEIPFDGTDRGAGIELCRRIKESDSALALIVVTGRLDPSDHVRARLVGADVHLTKPLSRGDVARALESCGVSLPADARRA